MDKKLRNRILNDYPLPIAIFFGRIAREEHLAQRNPGTYPSLFLSHITLFENINKLIAIIMLADYIREECFSEKLNRLIQSKFFKKPSLDDWHEIARETTRAFLTEGKTPFVSEISSLFFKPSRGKLKATRTLRLFEELIVIRNKKKAHSDTLSVGESRKLYEAISDKLAEILKDVSFLSEYCIISPIEVDKNTIKFYQELAGTAPRESYSEFETNLELEEGNVILTRKSQDRYIESLLLFPLSHFEIDYEDLEQYFCMYEDSQSRKDSISKLTYLGLSASTKSKEFVFRPQDEERNIWFEVFANLINSLATSRTSIAQTIANSFEQSSIDESRYYFYSQQALIERYIKVFVGREKISSQLKSFVETKESGYFLIVGSPGQGKTALSAHWVKKFNCVHHFVSASEGRNNEKLILQSLIYQLKRKIGVSYRISTDIDELRRDFSNVLQRLSEFALKNSRKEVILIDALDELNQDNRPSYLPDVLPSQVFIVLTSRPMQNSFDLHIKTESVFYLEPLSLSEVRALIEQTESQLNSHLINQIWEQCQGNPLLLKAILNHIKRSDGKVIDSLPNTIEQTYDSLLAPIRTKDGILVKILGLVAIAPNGITIHDLASVLSVSRYRIVASLKQVWPYLITDNKHIRLFHKTLYDYLLSGESYYGFDKNEQLELHKLVVEYFLEHLHQKYAYSSLLHHLFALEQFAKIGEIVSSEINYHASLERLIYSNITGGNVEQVSSLLDKLYDVDSIIIYELILKSFGELVSTGYHQLILRLLNTLRLSWHSASVADSRIDTMILYQQATGLRFEGRLSEALEVFESITQNMREIVGGDYLFKIELQEANAHREIGARGPAIEHYHKALALVDQSKEPENYLAIQHHLCDFMYVRGEFTQSIQGCNEALILAEKHNLKLSLGLLNRVKGHVHYITEDFSKAIEYYSLAEIFFSEAKAMPQLGKIYNNLSMAYASTDVARAVEYADLASDISLQFDLKLETGKTALARAIIDLESGRLSQATSHIDKAFQIYAEVGYRSGQAIVILYKAYIEYSKGDDDTASELADRCFALLSERDKPGYQIYMIKSQILSYLICEERGDDYSSIKRTVEEIVSTISPLTSSEHLISTIENNIRDLRLA